PSLCRMRLAVPLLCLAALAACSSPRPTPSPAASPSPSDDRALPDPLPDVVARIDGEPLYLRQVVPLVRIKLDKIKLGADKEKPRLMRQSLQELIDRELLLREALAQGTKADTRMVQQMYDAAHAGFPDEEQWKPSLYWRGFDPQSFKDELRAQQTIDVFLARASGAADAESADEVAERRTETARALVEKLRAKAR